MSGNKFLTVNRKACVTNFRLLIKCTTRTIASVNHIPQHRVFDREILYYHGVMDTGIHKPNYHW